MCDSAAPLGVFLSAHALAMVLVLGTAGHWAQEAPGDEPAANHRTVCKVFADPRVEEPVRAILDEYWRRTKVCVELTPMPAAQLDSLVLEERARSDVVIWLQEGASDKPPVSSASGAKIVAWKFPTGEPVWAAARTSHPHAAGIVRFLGGHTGHRLWSESSAGFTITWGKTAAEAYQWVVRHRTAHTYPMTAMRMLGELGGIRQGICIDVGCGTGHLAVELAERSDFRIVGLDIDPDMKPLFERTVHEAGLENRASFVLGDAQAMPFPDDHADVIVSRGTLIFIPDIGKCLREVDRVLKPTGVAFLGGRYVYAPQADKISTEKLKDIVRQSGVSGARVIGARGQWVKIVGPRAPDAAHRFQGGPGMLAGRIVADYAITEGRCLLIHGGDGGAAQALQHGLARMTKLEITALCPTQEDADAATERVRRENLSDRIQCCVGDIEALPLEDARFDLVAGAGPVLIWKDHVRAMRELHRVLADGGVALVGGRYLHMPDFRRVSTEALRQSALKTGIPSIRVIDDMGQWVEIRKGIAARPFAD